MARRLSREELVMDYFRTAPLGQAELALKLVKGTVKDRQRVHGTPDTSAPELPLSEPVSEVKVGVTADTKAA